MDLGKNIKLLRKAKNVTQVQLAQALGVANATVAYYELNKRQPNLEMLVRIANYFDTTTDFLLDNETTTYISRR